jgi:4-aminobutyrate aminotransferase
MDRATAEPSVRSMPGERASEWADYHHRFSAPSTYVYDFVWDTTADAHGPFCTDVDGNVLLDFTCHVGAAPLGYDNPVLRERLDAFDLPEPGKIAGQDFYASSGGTPADPDFPGPTQLMDRLTDITGHYGMDTVFLSNSGAEAVENAIKICYDHRDGAGYAYTFEGAFHGRTLGALSLNRSKSKYRHHFPEVSGVNEVPYCTDRTCDPETCGCGFFTDDGSVLRRRLDPESGNVDPGDVAYVIVEPIQGEGGYRIPSDAFMEELAAICDEHDLLLVSDEIQAGMGRTGEWWGADHYPIEPDVITAAKALRVGATIASEDVFPDRRGRISSTWGAGDLVAAMQGALTIDVVREENLLDNAVEKGRALHERVADADPPGVVDVRNRGLMFAAEFDDADHRDAAIHAALERGLLTLACGDRSIRLLPPLDVTDREVEMGADLFVESIRAVADRAAAD